MLTIAVKKAPLHPAGTQHLEDVPHGPIVVETSQTIIEPK